MDNDYKDLLAGADFCVYHSGCPDGIASAWVVKQTSPDVCLVPGRLGNPPNYELFGKEEKNIVIVDYCYRLDELAELCKIHNVLVIDHHKGAFDEVKDFTHERYSALFSMVYSACMLVSDSAEIDPPWFFDYIQDRDLWTFNYPETKDIMTAMHYHGYLKSVDDMDKLCKRDDHVETIKDELIIEGKMLNKIRDSDISYAVKTSILCNIDGIPCRIVSCDPKLRSDVGNNVLETYQDCEFVAIYRYCYVKDEWWISLRSRKGGADVNEIAKKYGGKGHINAAGFTIYGKYAKINDPSVFKGTLRDLFVYES